MSLNFQSSAVSFLYMAPHTSHAHCGHTHSHSHPPQIKNKTIFGLAIFLNLSFVVVELTFGFSAKSMALIADAGHNFFDVIGLVIASWAAFIMYQKPTAEFTYGLRSASILAALANSALMLISCVGFAWEAIRRIIVPVAVNGGEISVIATIGILINGFSAILFWAGSKHDLNIKGAFVHMLTDTAISAGVVLAGLGILATGWHWIDPVVSLIVIVVIVGASWRLLVDSLKLALHAVPPQINVTEIVHYLNSMPQVVDVHDLHIWGMSTQENALTVHLVINGPYPGEQFLDQLSDSLKLKFAIHHSTFQIELNSVGHTCQLAHS